MDQSLLGQDMSAFPGHAIAGLFEAQTERANAQIFRSYQRRRPGGVPDDLFRLRYEVYCVERAYLTADPAVGGMELDDYDDCSTHFAAYAGADDALIGTVRLVTPDSERCYPFQRHCTTFADFAMPEQGACAEISRLAVRRSHRRRRGDCVAGLPGHQARDPAEVDRRSNGCPMLLLGMYREMFRHSRCNNIGFWFAAMERSLARSLKKMGFHFVQIGPVSDYYGKVTPYLLDVSQVVPNLIASNPELGAWFDEVALVLTGPLAGTPLGCQDH